MPVTRQIGWKDRTVLQPAGILVLRGSPGGTPSMTYQRTVRAGEYPGPLTPRNSASQTVVAYAVERADEVTQGLNPVTIYVQSDGANPVSMSVLESRMTTYINQVAPGLLTSGAGGQLQEIIPYGRGMWRGFVDIGEVTQDYIDLSSQANVTPRFLSVSGHITGQAPGASDSPAR